MFCLAGFVDDSRVPANYLCVDVSGACRGAQAPSPRTPLLLLCFDRCGEMGHCRTMSSIKGSTIQPLQLGSSSASTSGWFVVSDSALELDVDSFLARMTLTDLFICLGSFAIPR